MKTTDKPVGCSRRRLSKSRSTSCGTSTAVGSSRISTVRVAIQRLEDLDPLALADRQVLDQRQRRHLDAQRARRPRPPGDARPRDSGARRGCGPAPRFRPTVSGGTRAKCWVTMPMPSAIASLGERIVAALAVHQDVALVGAGRGRRGCASGWSCPRRFRPAAHGSARGPARSRPDRSPPSEPKRL